MIKIRTQLPKRMMRAQSFPFIVLRLRAQSCKVEVQTARNWRTANKQRSSMAICQSSEQIPSICSSKNYWIRNAT